MTGQSIRRMKRSKGYIGSDFFTKLWICRENMLRIFWKNEPPCLTLRYTNKESRSGFQRNIDIDYTTSKLIGKLINYM